jgi:hypothetical protein
VAPGEGAPHDDGGRGASFFSWSGCRVSVMTGVEVRNWDRSATSNSWMTVPILPLFLSRTTILAW